MMKHVIAGIINGNYELLSRERVVEFPRFWNKYGPDLLKIRNDNSISKQFEELKKISDKMLDKCKNLKKELEKLKEKYMEDYYIPCGEVPIYRLK